MNTVNTNTISTSKSVVNIRKNNKDFQSITPLNRDTINKELIFEDLNQENIMKQQKKSAFYTKSIKKLMKELILKENEELKVRKVIDFNKFKFYIEEEDEKEKFKTQKTMRMSLNRRSYNIGNNRIDDGNVNKNKNNLYSERVKSGILKRSSNINNFSNPITSQTSTKNLKSEENKNKTERNDHIVSTSQSYINIQNKEDTAKGKSKVRINKSNADYNQVDIKKIDLNNTKTSKKSNKIYKIVGYSQYSHLNIDDNNEYAINKSHKSNKSNQSLGKVISNISKSKKQYKKRLLKSMSSLKKFEFDEKQSKSTSTNFFLTKERDEKDENENENRYTPFVSSYEMKSIPYVEDKIYENSNIYMNSKVKRKANYYNSKFIEGISSNLNRFKSVDKKRPMTGYVNKGKILKNNESVKKADNYNNKYNNEILYKNTMYINIWKDNYFVRMISKKRIYEL